MDRRRFLAAGCKAAAGVTALVLTQKRLFAASSESDFSPLMSIGFAPALPPDDAFVRLADAASISLPDPTFISRGARVSVVASARGARHTNDDGVALDASMPAYGNPRFRFWSAAGDRVSGNLGFSVAVPATSGINLVARRVQRTAKKDEGARTPPIDVDPAPFTLTLGGVAGPKLQRGIYVVALRESAGETMADWSRFSIAAHGGVYSVDGAGFAWVMLKIDYAT
ncbi:MAG TPA: hypothetical protein VI670_25955 [Thermoanaerobaculia bacterium]|jgi:hypothetical protein